VRCSAGGGVHRYSQVSLSAPPASRRSRQVDLLHARIRRHGVEHHAVAVDRVQGTRRDGLDATAAGTPHRLDGGVALRKPGQRTAGEVDRETLRPDIVGGGQRARTAFERGEVEWLRRPARAWRDEQLRRQRQSGRGKDGGGGGQELASVDGDYRDKSAEYQQP